MSEIINNREHRQEVLKEIIRDLHSGKDVNDVKERFRELLRSVGPSEISELEQSLIDEGLPAEEIQALCDVHVALFREGLDELAEVEKEQGAEEKAHPVNVFKQENAAVDEVINSIRDVLDQIKAKQLGADISTELDKWRELHTELKEIEKHYSRKENILFPYLEKNGITGPPSVMWGIHDEIRSKLKEIDTLLAANREYDQRLSRQIADQVVPCLNQISEMIYKEENILFPMCLETLTEDEWKEIAAQSDDIGYTLIQPQADDFTVEEEENLSLKGEVPDGFLKFETGILTLEEISLIFNHLPVDITFVDKDDRVRYFSQGKERIFERTKAIIGRKVQNCHPPASVHIVNQIVSDFKSGQRDTADFWIEMGEKFVYIRYFAVRDQHGQYAGTLEVTQNVQEIRQLTGEKRIYDEGK